MKENQKISPGYHFILWMIYILLWSARDMIYHDNFLNNLLFNFLFNLLLAPFIYLNLYFLIPQFLLKKNWIMYSLLFGISFILMYFARFYAYQITLKGFGAMAAAERFASWDGFVILISENIVLTMISMSIFLIKEWYSKEKYAHELEQKNMESELRVLKGQLQPHFLFNNLNTIYFLMEKNPVLAKEVMIRFSEVLSHQLYQANKDKVMLKDELNSLESFLKIQQIRHDDFLNLKYSLPQTFGDLQIAPMILLTFVENAFKHGQSEQGYDIDISVKIDDSTLHFISTNTIGDKHPATNGGLGLENVKRRLSLIYPERHTLLIKETKENYSVNLTITLDSNGKA